MYVNLMRRSAILLWMLLTAGAVHAQTVPSAASRQFSLTAGGMASIFQPDFEGDWQPPCYCEYPLAQASPFPLIGAGAYVDVRLTRWVQIEAEGRWLRFNQYGGINQDNYLLGPRLPVFHFGGRPSMPRRSAARRR